MKLRHASALILLATSTAFANSHTSPQASSAASVSSQLVMPAEWEKHESVWISWPTYESIKGRPSEVVHYEIIKALAPFVKVDVAVNSKAEIAQIRKSLKKQKISSNHVRFHVIPHNDIWIRDMGAIFVKDGGRLKVVDFGFNMWGYEEPTSEGSKKEEQVDRLIAKKLGKQTLKSKVIMEGGALEFNGKGTLISTEAVALQRNPGMKLEDIEAEYKRLFGIKKVIWVKRGVAEDDHTFKGKLPGDVFTMITTNGHIDEFARFANPTTLLLAEVSQEEAARDPIAKMTAERLEESYQILKNATDQDGKPFTIIRVPMPDNMFEMIGEGDGTYDYIKGLKYEDGTTFEPGKKVKAVLAASYLNYFVTNGVVLAPSFWKPGRADSVKKKDEMVLKALQEAFPDRKIVQINPENVNIGGGGIHCITQQQPAL